MSNFWGLFSRGTTYYISHFLKKLILLKNFSKNFFILFAKKIKNFINLIDLYFFKKIMKYFPKLIWEKVYLSPLNPDDAEILTKWMNDMEITDWTHKSPVIYWLLQSKNRLEKKPDWINFQFAIIKKKWDELIWTTWLYNVNHINQTAELGIMIWDTQNHNKWYWEDAIKALLNFWFNTLNLYNIYLWVKAFNKNWIACYKKCGFKEIWTRHHCEYCNGERYDLIMMEILKPDWQEKN